MPYEIDIHKELQNLNVKVAETGSDLKALCKKFDTFMDHGAPRCADQEARLTDLEKFHDTFNTASHPVCQAGKGKWEDTKADITSLKNRQWWILSAVVVQAGLIILKFMTG